jgi:putative SOS response-associated peptidase YedK
MCGRYTLSHRTPADVGAPFDVRGSSLPLEALGRSNVCPTEDVLTVVGGSEPRMMRWGLAPSWATLKGMRPLINARDDKLRTSSAWKALAGDAASRCLIVADGWYEWQTAEDARRSRPQPFLHRIDGGAPFAFAGLWCEARPKDAAATLVSCTIVTTRANRDAARLHDRMPAVLSSREERAAWLDRSVDLDGALELVKPLPEGVLEIVPASIEADTVGTDQLSLLA